MPEQRRWPHRTRSRRLSAGGGSCLCCGVGLSRPGGGTRSPRLLYRRGSVGGPVCRPPPELSGPAGHGGEARRTSRPLPRCEPRQDRAIGAGALSGLRRVSKTHPTTQQRGCGSSTEDHQLPSCTTVFSGMTSSSLIKQYCNSS